MSFLKKTLGFMAILAIAPTALAATARPSIIATASSRMPTLSAYITNAASATSVSGVSPTLADKECIEAYTDCAKGTEVCGPNFEECTNKTLFFAKKAQCAGTLMLCGASGITSLFGTNVQTAFSTKNSAGEYTYPTDGSVLGQLIESGAITNRYDTSTCVKRYTNCLKKDDVCGADFELCTSNTEFKKQKLFCESTLARCQNEGKTELFGTTNTASNPTASSRIGILISEGGALAAVNSVATCYKVADQCILNACAQNPYMCKEGSGMELVNIVQEYNAWAENINADGVANPTTYTGTDTYQSNMINPDLSAVSRANISGFIKKSCQDTIGGNKFCYATFLGNGAMPTNSQLQDQDNRADIYAEAYSSRMNDSMKAKIDDLIETFAKKTKQRCQNTITSCAMRSCGEGSGAACYASAFNTENATKGVANPTTLADIKHGCEAVINSDTSCKYSAATFNSGAGLLNFLDTTLFDRLFTDPSETNGDPVGAVAALNARLSLNYNQAALDQMKKRCETVAGGCVRTMCGTDFTSCYRNRTDVYSSLTKTGMEAFDKSMNKVGGVLDYTVIIGLCLNTVKNNPVCEEHIKAEAARRSASTSYTADSWGAGADGTTTRAGWLGAGEYSVTAADGATTIQATDADGNLMCTTGKDNTGEIGRCDDINGKFNYPRIIGASEYRIAQAERTIFRDLVYDLEKEAQAQYNAKLTKQQNMCMANNSGGIIGAKDLGGTFQWVKLRSNKVPTNYQTKGLTTSQFVASNELYGSFCRIRVTLQSDDKNIQDKISTGKDWGVAYFAAGDAFTCGSWIPESELEAISNEVAAKKTGTNADGSLKKGQKWGVAGLSILGAVGGGLGMNALQKGKLGGLLGTNNTNKSAEQNTAVDGCVKKVQDGIKKYEDNKYSGSGDGYGHSSCTWSILRSPNDPDDSKWVITNAVKHTANTANTANTHCM
jgi:hypothetical protein